MDRERRPVYGSYSGVKMPVQINLYNITYNNMYSV